MNDLPRFNITDKNLELFKRACRMYLPPDTRVTASPSNGPDVDFTTNIEDYHTDFARIVEKEN